MNLQVDPPNYPLTCPKWEFPKSRGCLRWGVLIMRILLFRVLY